MNNDSPMISSSNVVFSTLEEESLFSSLYTKCKNLSEEITPGKARGFIKKTSEMDALGHQLIYKIILIFSCDISASPMIHGLPFDALIATNNDVVFGFRQLPHVLQHMLIEFANLHTKKMKCDKIRNYNK